MQETDHGNVQACLLSDIDNEEDSTITINEEESSAIYRSVDIRQETARSSNVTRAETYCEVDSSNKEGVDEEVANCPWVPPFGQEENSEGGAVQQ